VDEPPSGFTLSPIDKAIAQDYPARRWSKNVPERSCTKDDECGDGFCDRGRAYHLQNQRLHRTPPGRAATSSPRWLQQGAKALEIRSCAQIREKPGAQIPREIREKPARMRPVSPPLFLP
jgi:hypothetical protein